MQPYSILAKCTKAWKPISCPKEATSSFDHSNLSATILSKISRGYNSTMADSIAPSTVRLSDRFLFNGGGASSYDRCRDCFVISRLTSRTLSFSGSNVSRQLSSFAAVSFQIRCAPSVEERPYRLREYWRRRIPGSYVYQPLSFSLDSRSKDTLVVGHRCGHVRWMFRHEALL